MYKSDVESMPRQIKKRLAPSKNYSSEDDIISLDKKPYKYNVKKISEALSNLNLPNF